MAADYFGIRVQLGYSVGFNNTLFTIKDGAKEVSFVTGLHTCHMQSLTYNVTGISMVGNPEAFDGREVCPVVAERRPPATPCVIKINEAKASSIMADIAATACVGSHLNSPICSSNTSIAARITVTGTGWGKLAACILFGSVFWAF